MYIFKYIYIFTHEFLVYYPHGRKDHSSSCNVAHRAALQPTLMSLAGTLIDDVIIIMHDYVAPTVAGGTSSCV